MYIHCRDCANLFVLWAYKFLFSIKNVYQVAKEYIVFQTFIEYLFINFVSINFSLKLEQSACRNEFLCYSSVKEND